MKNVFYSVILLMINSSVVLSSGSDVIGFGARGISMGNTGASASNDSSAVFYNAALLIEIKNHLMLGTTLTDMYIDIVPFEGSSGDKYGGVTNMYGLYLSGKHDLKFNNFAFGFGIYLPTNRIHLEKSYFPDEREHYFSNKIYPELYGVRSEGESIYLAGAYRVLSNFSIGAGTIMKINSFAPSYQYLPSIIRTDQMYLNLNAEEKIKLFPVAGIFYRPVDNLSIGLSYRASTYFKIVSRSYTEVRGLTKPGEPNVFEEVFLFQFTPNEYTGSISVRYSNWLATTDLVYEEYSDYRDSHNRKPVVPFKDIISAHFGVEHLLTDSWLLRGGYVFKPTPVPEQNGRTNYADTDVHYVTLGNGFIWNYEGWKLRLDLYVLLMFFEERINRKTKDALDPVIDEDQNLEGIQSRNPGYPGFTMSGFGYGGGISLSIFY
ncbi:MAG: outer membrane protein transport protein [Deltaproteobacteria bacterium]|nr:outer membrane protein transport protein [Deltaproteobacteria bacterium]